MARRIRAKRVEQYSEEFKLKAVHLANLGGVRTKEEARASLTDAITLILEDRREDALCGVPPEAERATVVVE